MERVLKFWVLALIALLGMLPMAGRADQSRGYFSVSVRVIRQCDLTVNIPENQSHAVIEGSIGMNCTRGTSFTVRVVPALGASGNRHRRPYAGLGSGQIQTIPIAYRLPVRVADVQGSNPHAVQLVINY